MRAMSGGQSFRDPRSDVRVLDPAYRDCEERPWVSGRFSERVRREWNPVRTEVIRASPDLGSLADAIHAITGADREDILARLELFADVEEASTASRLRP
jgi:hypothetical protein